MEQLGSPFHRRESVASTEQVEHNDPDKNVRPVAGRRRCGSLTFHGQRNCEGLVRAGTFGCVFIGKPPTAFRVRLMVGSVCGCQRLRTAGGWIHSGSFGGCFPDGGSFVVDGLSVVSGFDLCYRAVCAQPRIAFSAWYLSGGFRPQASAARCRLWRPAAHKFSEPRAASVTSPSVAWRSVGGDNQYGARRDGSQHFVKIHRSVLCR